MIEKTFKAAKKGQQERWAWALKWLKIFELFNIEKLLMHGVTEIFAQNLHYHFCFVASFRKVGTVQIL